jgi:hypothetical protein
VGGIGPLYLGSLAFDAYWPHHGVMETKPVAFLRGYGKAKPDRGLHAYKE